MTITTGGGGKHPRRRYTDVGTLRGLWHDVMPVIALGLAAWAVVLNGDKADQAELKAVRVDVRSAARSARVERKDRDMQRATAWRLCNRQRVDRAFAHSRIASRGGPSALRKLERPEQLPILDCDPNLRGQPAKAMSPRQQRRFVVRWERGELSPADRGICRTPIDAARSPGDC